MYSSFIKMILSHKEFILRPPLIVTYYLALMEQEIRIIKLLRTFRAFLYARPTFDTYSSNRAAVVRRDRAHRTQIGTQSTNIAFLRRLRLNFTNINSFSFLSSWQEITGAIITVQTDWSMRQGFDVDILHFLK